MSVNPHSTEIILFSNNNYKLGERVRESFQKINMYITYCNTLKLLVKKLEKKRNYIVFIDKYYKKHAHFVSEIAGAGLEVIDGTRFVFIDDDMKHYAEHIDNERVFCIPETNLEVALYNIITTCEMLNYQSRTSDEGIRRVKENMSKMLAELGFSCKLAGFRYIIHGMEQAIKNNFTLGSLNAEVYPYIAEQNFTTTINIERGIRTSVQRAAKQEEFKKVVKGAEGVPVTNRFFMEYFLNQLIIYKNSIGY